MTGSPGEWARGVPHDFEAARDRIVSDVGQVTAEYLYASQRLGAYITGSEPLQREALIELWDLYLSAMTARDEVMVFLSGLLPDSHVDSQDGLGPQRQ